MITRSFHMLLALVLVVCLATCTPHAISEEKGPENIDPAPDETDDPLPEISLAVRKSILLTGTKNIQEV